METSKQERGIIPSNGLNYSVWKKRVRLLLKERHILYIIDEDIPIIPESKWVKKNDVAHSVISVVV